ncbi:MAG: pyridoxamine 5'-phosphate oxidase family protein [Chitinophagaceae bacterium]|nr:pyridoxamine 5'-phosphate oxidase family protein [Chitinophagaceae bacterium]
MVSNLTEIQIDELLERQIVGRIGCSINNKIYVVPISYAYEGNSIYVHTYEGMKIDAMRGNPEVCFEVDDYADMANWQSVIAWGRFEEITDPEDRAAAIQILLHRNLPMRSSETTHIGEHWPFFTDNESIEGIIFRIVIAEKTGRRESYSNSAKISG